MTANEGDFTVSDSMVSRDGGSGWDGEDYGPFVTEAVAEDFARRLASEGYSATDGERRLVKVLSNGWNRGGEDHHTLFSWCSDEDDDETVHTLGPSDEEKASLLMVETEEAE